MRHPALPTHRLTTAAAFFLLAIIATLTGVAAGAEPETDLPPPNILWITAEDMSATLGAYGDDYATTPNLDRLAEQSVRYTQAYANSPVCSTARSTLITGNFAPSLGTHQMRSAFPLPEQMQGFPALLRQRGYHTTNNVKTDYNTGSEPRIIQASWNRSSERAHWRNRHDDDQPFFSVFNLMTSHQSRTMVWPYEQFVDEVQSRLASYEVHDPDDAPVPPYYPDTPLIRREIARYYDCVAVMDKEVGEILRQLEEDGLADSTIVFFYSDHGSGMPRHKRAALDTGLHVPLMVRFPEKYQHLAPAEPGGTVDRLVSFVDFGPTVLSLVEIDVPDFMQGIPFLGEQTGEPKRQLYHYRDRVDEVRDLQRAVRDEQYLYVRNYMPHLGYNQYTWWPDLGDLRHEFYRLADADTMTDAQYHFAGPTRPPEELHDYRDDPLNLNNLADSPEHRHVLQRLRQAHRDQLREHRDLGFIPESQAWNRFESTTPWEAGQSGEVDLEPLFHAAEMVGFADEPALLKNLQSDDAGVRYWGAIGLAARDSLSDEAKQQLRARLDDPSPAARIEIANALARHGDVDTALPVLIDALQHESLDVLLHAARTIELLGDDARDAADAMRQARDRAHDIRPPETAGIVIGEKDLAWFVTMSIDAFFNRLNGNDP